MSHRRSKHLLLPLLALSMSLALAASVHAQERQNSSDNRVSATLRISLGSGMRWSNVSGTRVEEITAGPRPDCDVFRVDGTYYAYNSDHWYSSRSDRGDFVMINDADVPRDLNSVPREHWRHYPGSWAQASDRRDDQGPNRVSASIQIDLGNRTRWAGIRGTRVDEVRGGRPDYDVFRCRGVYYVYTNDGWYMSRRGRGMFMAIDGRDVPWELSRVPREHWRHYPDAWMQQQQHDSRNGNRNGNRHDGDRSR